jgi:hypothetical protein
MKGNQLKKVHNLGAMVAPLDSITSNTLIVTCGHLVVGLWGGDFHFIPNGVQTNIG